MPTLRGQFRFSLHRDAERHLSCAPVTVLPFLSSLSSISGSPASRRSPAAFLLPTDPECQTRTKKEWPFLQLGEQKPPIIHVRVGKVGATFFGGQSEFLDAIHFSVHPQPVATAFLLCVSSHLTIITIITMYSDLNAAFLFLGLTHLAQQNAIKMRPCCG